ncbi:helix-turn-helix domain-containing protein [Cryobacterium sp. 10C3]|uniref:TetR/AcrR family transcriptional regulator n=1 Tax=Cryobacterium sp. 10C3 TaxID=3048577 RepID=UPI002AB394E5|nr:helix-turn-helix domain-containing protein [Cryobacterium sp. 10C3]MDY7558038.1 helix-turn-helix domain-containing protein [Cryobacterium sp. 10C3]
MPRATGTKRAILDAALELAATRGITGTTMDDVAELAHVAKGSLYYNFSSKDKLFEALLEEGSARSPTPSGRRVTGCTGGRRSSR